MQLQSSLRHESRRGQPGLRGDSRGIAVQNDKRCPRRAELECTVAPGCRAQSKAACENAIHLRYLVRVNPSGPFNVVGSYFHCSTAFNAAAINNGCPLTTRVCTTFPRSSMIASTTTTPRIRASRASRIFRINVVRLARCFEQ
jgi:hypothetical protein